MALTITMSEHAGRHDIGSGPLARESLLHCFQLPEHGLAGHFYTWVGGDGTAGFAAWVYGGNEDGSTIFEFGDGIPVGADADLDDWRIGSLTMSQSASAPTARIAYESERIGADFEFRPMHEAYVYSDAPGGCPAYFGTDRLEQSGHVRGTLRVDGREFAVDTQGHHDHSWGTRDWAMIQHYKWIEAQAGDSAVHVFELNGLGDRPLIGYVFRDGLLSGVREADWEIEYDEELFQRTVTVRVVDESDRTTTLTGTSYARFEFPVHASASLVDTVMHAEIEGVAGAAYFDLLWPPDYLAHMRATER